MQKMALFGDSERQLSGRLIVCRVSYFTDRGARLRHKLNALIRVHLRYAYKSALRRYHARRLETGVRRGRRRSQVFGPKVRVSA
jgi:hypothetical protein